MRDYQEMKEQLKGIETDCDERLKELMKEQTGQINFPEPFKLDRDPDQAVEGVDFDKGIIFVSTGNVVTTEKETLFKKGITFFVKSYMTNWDFIALLMTIETVLHDRV